MARRIIDLILMTCSISVAWFLIDDQRERVLDACADAATPETFRDALGVFVLVVGSGVAGGYIVSTWRYND